MFDTEQNQELVRLRWKKSKMQQFMGCQKVGAEIVRSCLNTIYTIGGMQHLNQLSGSRRPPGTL